MWLVVDAARIKTAEIRARLNQRRDAACEAIAFGVSFAELSREQIGQLDLADLAFDLIVSHFRFEIVFETVFTEQLYEELLSQIRVGRARALFDEEAGAARGAYEGMMRNYAVKLGPETIDVRRSQALHPSRILSALVAARIRQRATITALEVRFLFRIFAYGFHRLSFALLVWEFVF